LFTISVKSLPWPLDIHGSKIFFIAISFHRNIVRQNGTGTGRFLAHLL
jgi:hypothetical protein